MFSFLPSVEKPLQKPASQVPPAQTKAIAIPASARQTQSKRRDNRLPGDANLLGAIEPAKDPHQNMH